MKKFALSLLLLLALTLERSSFAGVPCSVPFNLQNGTPADATQVMANYNALITCFANAAAAGANNDITSLIALTTPISPAAGGTQTYIGGDSGGTANAQTVNPVTPTGFTFTAGKQVMFRTSFINTGATTVDVGGTGAVPVFRLTAQAGLQPLVGGEMITGEWVTLIVHPSGLYQIVGDRVIVGEIRDYAGVSPPPGWLFADGSCQLRTGVTNFLFLVIGTTYDPTGSTCDTAHFALPDARGRVLVGNDAMGGTPANRLTLAGSNCNGTINGAAGCGTQNYTLTSGGSGNIPSAAVTFPSSVISQTFGSSPISVALSGTFTPTITVVGRTGKSLAGVASAGSDLLVGGVTTNDGNSPGSVAAIATSNAVNIGVGGGWASASFNNNALSSSFNQTALSASVGTATPTPVPLVQPTLVVNKIIKY